MNLPLLIPGLLFPLLIVLCAVIHAIRNRMKPVTMTPEQKQAYAAFAKKARNQQEAKRAAIGAMGDARNLNY